MSWFARAGVGPGAGGGRVKAPAKAEEEFWQATQQSNENEARTSGSAETAAVYLEEEEEEEEEEEDELRTFVCFVVLFVVGIWPTPTPPVQSGAQAQDTKAVVVVGAIFSHAGVRPVLMGTNLNLFS